MAPPVIQSVEKDLSEVTIFLERLKTLGSPIPVEKKSLMRKIHYSTYSLILWKFRLKNLPLHGKPFIEEVASDALQLLPQLLLGYKKTVRLLGRSIIENTIRHIYFSDHPVEFARMNRDKKWYLEIKELFNYLKSHHDLCESAFLLGIVDELTSLYSDLSTGIHGTKVADLEMRRALKAIQYNQDAAVKEEELLRRLTAPCNILLTVFHRKRFSKFSSEDRRILIHSMSRSQRSELGKILGEAL